MGIEDLLNAMAEQSDKESLTMNDVLDAIGEKAFLELAPKGELITSGKSFDKTNESFKESAEAGNEEEGAKFIAIVDRDVLKAADGTFLEDKKCMVGHVLVFSNSKTGTVSIRNQYSTNHFTMAQLESLEQALALAKADLQIQAAPVQTQTQS